MVVVQQSVETQIQVLWNRLDEAGQAYLEQTRGKTPERYAEIEPWAFAEFNAVRMDVNKKIAALEKQIA